MFDTYNEKDNYDVQGNYDPRLFHTVAIPGFPYKYNVNYIFDKTWTRNEQEYYGLYSSLKENVDPDCSCLKKVNSPFVALCRCSADACRGFDSVESFVGSIAVGQ